MAEMIWGIADEQARAVSRHVQSILPDVEETSNVYFEQNGPLPETLLPEDGIAGGIHVAGGIGSAGEFKVSVVKTINLEMGGEDGDAVDRTVHLTFYRSKSKHLDELDPFEYVVQIRNVEGVSTRTDMRRVTIADVESDQFLGADETVAALLLAEIVAEKMVAADSAGGRENVQPSSFLQSGSIEAAATETGLQLGSISLDWGTVNSLLGPAGNTLAANPVVKMTIPDPAEFGRPNAIDFVADDGIIEEDREPPQVSSLEDSLEELLADTITDEFDSDEQIISHTRSKLLSAKSRYDSKVDSFPERFVRNLSEGNFGAAESLLAADANTDRIILVYAFQQLYEGVTELLAAQDSIEDLSLAVTAFANGLAAGDLEMARRGLERASAAYVDVTQHLLENAKNTIQSIRAMLSYYDLVESFNNYLEAESELTGDDLAFYESALEQLIESARKQHERSEKAREVFHWYKA